MSHRKFEHPRCGSLGFLPRKRCRRGQGRIKSFPKDDPSKYPHLTAFMGYKVGMTHIVREVDRPGSKLHKKETCESVTIIECPPMIAVGITGYAKTAFGYKTLSVIWAQHLSDVFRRRMEKNWYKTRAKARPFAHPEKDYIVKGDIQKRLAYLKENCDIIRLICHTQVNILNPRQKKANVMEIQVNGGTVSDKIDFAYNLLEKPIPIDSIFQCNEMIDTISITKGKGREGVVTRWGVTRLPRKTHRGLRKVACIGAWHPARVSWTVARAGQNGFYHRTQVNHKIYKIGKKGEKTHKATTSFDITEKDITPMGAFVRYGTIRDDYIMIKGSIAGTKKRPITLRQSLRTQASRKALEEINLKFISTAAQFGHGRFQTTAEKLSVMGKMKEGTVA